MFRIKGGMTTKPFSPLLVAILYSSIYKNCSRLLFHQWTIEQMNNDAIVSSAKNFMLIVPTGNKVEVINFSKMKTKGRKC